jgi:putative DNA primase/helicase
MAENAPFLRGLSPVSGKPVHLAFDGGRLAFSYTREIGRLLRFDGKASTANGAEKFAQSDTRLAVTHEAWDPDAFSLGTPGGVVNLRDGTIRPARADDMITRSASVAPRRGPHPLWDQFLDDVTRGDKDYQRFLQQIAGYCLTGDTREQALFFLYGAGGNGKGVFVAVLRGILADYTKAAAMDTFLARFIHEGNFAAAIERG